MFWGTRNRRKFLFIPSKFRLFRGTKNATTLGIQVQANPLKIKSLEVCLNHFVEEKIIRNFVSFGTIPLKVKALVIPFQTIL
jgi:hypothetical protein